jgi:hypothetical protein
LWILPPVRNRLRRRSAFRVCCSDLLLRPSYCVRIIAIFGLMAVKEWFSSGKRT